MNKKIKIPLSQGKEAIIDECDAPDILPFRWHAQHRRRKSCGDVWYAARNVKTSKGFTIIKMHRVIMNAPAGFDVDHIDSNGLNNTRKNLRVCTKSQNAQNSRKRKGTSSRFVGVDYRRDIEKWQARVKSNNVRVHLGCFENEIQAASAYNAKAKELFGQYARLNVIPEAVE